MSIGIFTNKKFKPSLKEIQGKLGSASADWNELVDFVNFNFKCKSDLAFYGKNYGWSMRFKNSKGSVISLYPAEEFFTAQIVLGTKLAIAAQNLKLHKKVNKIFDEATLYPEGKWLFIKIESKNDIDDVKLLLNLKMIKP